MTARVLPVLGVGALVVVVIIGALPGLLPSISEAGRAAIF